MIAVLLAACSGPDPSTDGNPPSGDTDTDTVPDTDTDTGTVPDTDTGTASGFCISEQDVTSGVLASAWRSPTGTLYATGSSPSSRVRAPDGVWTIDAVQQDAAWQYQIDGADDTEVWALTSDAARRREPDGTWTDMGAPTDLFELRGLRVFAPDDVLVLRVEDVDCADCPTRDTPVLLWWDGASWTEDRKPEIGGSVFGMTVLPDRTVVLAADGGLRAIDPVPAPIATPPAMYVRSVVSAPDGTLVALGGDAVAIGTAAGGLASADPGLYVNEWSYAWASSANDVWISGEWWELGVIPHAVIAHWDGSAWTPVVADWPGESFRLAGGDGEVFAVGGYTHELVLVGDEDGLQLDRETWGPNYLNEMVVDDVTGNVWSIGYGPVLGVYEAGVWRGEPLPDQAIKVDKLAASDGRVLLSDAGEALHVYEAGAVVTTPTPDWFYYWLAAADGVLFAAGRPFGDNAPSGISLVQNVGAGWEPIDLGGLPAGAEPAALWADGPTDLWFGLEIDRHGALAHWDGLGWTVVLEDLDSPPGWMGRLSDGQLYFTRFTEAGSGGNSLWVFDGTTAAPVPDMPPDVRAAHLLPDGTWFTSVIAIAATGDEDLFGALLQKDPGGGWVEVFRADYGITMVGAGDTVWAEQEELSWTRAPCVTP